VPAGQGHQLLEFRLTGGAVTDNSFDPEPVAFPRVPAGPNDGVFAPIALPDISNLTPRITRTFRFDRSGGGWTVNGQFMDCTKFRLTAQRNTAEKWSSSTTPAPGSTPSTSTSRSTASSAATACR
jgi:hypothetical protein